MECLLRRPDGTQTQMSLDVLRFQAEAGAVNRSWHARPEGSPTWTTVDLLLANPSDPALPPAATEPGWPPTDSTAVRRSEDAYRAASSAASCGLGLKLLAPVLGLGTALVAVLAGKGAVVGALLGTLVAVPLFALGVLLRALAALLKAALSSTSREAGTRSTEPD